MSVRTYWPAFLQCGLCEHKYELDIPAGETKIPACPNCRSTTLQMLRCPDVKPAKG